MISGFNYRLCRYRRTFFGAFEQVNGRAFDFLRFFRIRRIKLCDLGIYFENLTLVGLSCTDSHTVQRVSIFDSLFQSLHVIVVRIIGTAYAPCSAALSCRCRSKLITKCYVFFKKHICVVKCFLCIGDVFVKLTEIAFE